MADQPTSRPKASDPAIRAEVVRRLAIDCFEWSEDMTVDQWIAALSEVYLTGNGYEIARDLERYAHVEPDADLVEVLDSAASYLWFAHDEAVKAWVAEAGIVPSLHIGQRARCRFGEGTISGIRAALARYTFVPFGEEEKYKNGGGWVVEFECVEPLTAEAA